MEIVLIACLATLGVCAMLAGVGKHARIDRKLHEDSQDPLDQALFHLINEVTRAPVRRNGTVPPDSVLVGSRLRAIDSRRTTWV
jgi:hypothetical protein